MKILLSIATIFLLIDAEAQQAQLRVPISHTGSIQGVSISPDNKFVITAGADKTLKLWETASGSQIKSLDLNDIADRQAKFMKDNRHVMVQTDSGWQYWDVIAGIREFSFNGFKKYPGEKLGFCISKDGTQGMVYRKSSIELYNAITGTLIRSYSYTNTEDYFYVGFRRMNKDFYINVNYGVSTRVLNLITGEVYLVQLPEGDISYFDISPVDNILFASTRDNFYKIDLVTKQVQKLPFTGYGKEIVLSDDGTKLMTGNNTIYNKSNLQEEGFVDKLSGYDRNVSINASYFVSFDNKTGNGEWANTKERKIIRRFVNETNWLLRLTVNQNTKQLVFTTGANEFRLWDIANYQYEKNVVMKQAQAASFDWYGASFTQEGFYYVANGYYNKYVYDFRTGNQVYETKSDLKAVSADGKVGFFTDNGKGEIKNLQTDELLGVTAYTYPQIRFSPDNTHMVYSSTLASDLRHIYNYKTKKDVLMDAVIGDDLVFSTDGRRIFASDLFYYCSDPCDPLITTTDVETGKVIRSVKIKGEPGMRVSEIAVSADEKYISILYLNKAEFYMATNNRIITYEMATGKEAGRAIKVNGDEELAYWGKTYLVATVSQRTNLVEIWDALKGKNLLNITHFKAANDWIAITPDGFYDGNMESLKKFYYVSGNEVVDPDLYFEKFYTPDLFARIVNGETFRPDDTGLKGVPKVQVNYASATRNLEVDEDIPTYENTTGAADITVTATAPDDAIDEIRLFHNGKIVTLTTRNLIVADDTRSNSATKKYTVNLLPGMNTFRAVALNTQRTESKPDEMAVIYNAGNNNNSSAGIINNTDGAPVTAVDKNATMHLIVVGINQYKNKKLSLNYALADATSFKEEIEKDASTMISNIQTYFVTDNEADRPNIEKAFSNVKQKAKPEDVFVFYYAGHGVIGSNKEFYLVPTDVSDLNNAQKELENKGIAAKLLQQYAIDIQAQKQVFILDACQSAGAFEAMLSNDANKQKSIAVLARSTGTHWMAASGAQQYANEFASLGHGAFTYVLLEALKGAASNDNMITVNNLKNYLQQMVPELMKKYHGTPQYPASYGFGNDFPVKQ